MITPPPSKPIRVHRRGDPYPVWLGAGLLEHVGELCLALWRSRDLSRVGIVSQTRVLRLHGEPLRRGLSRVGLEPVLFPIHEGEHRKNLRTVESVYDWLVDKGFSRDDVLLAFGGGTVGDTAGFVAATYLRGISYAQLPTTLLAQVDSAIGAKVGVNHDRGKNLVGAIYRPGAVWIDSATLATLPARDHRSGLYELLKYGFIGSPRILGRFETEALSPESTALRETIADGVRRKLQVVREDEAETGLRRILNFGHTIGHGLEAASDYKLLRHGEAVGWGMIGAIRLGARRGCISARLAHRLEALVRRIGPLPGLSGLELREALEAIRSDKKRSAKGLRFILPSGWGRVTIVSEFPEGEIAWALDSLGLRS